MILGLALALASALATNVAFLLKQRGAVLAPSVHVRHPLRSAAGLFRSRWFALGWVVAVGAWGLHVGALALAPLSIVQAVLAAGLVFLAVLAERFFGFALGRRQWIGLIITAVGLAIIALTSGAARWRGSGLCAGRVDRRGMHRLCPRHRARRDLQPPRRPAREAGPAPRRSLRRAVRRFRHRAQVPHPRRWGGVLELISPWTFAALAASVVAFYASARGLQLGPGVEVIALTAVAANLTAIIGGILVFRDPIGTGPVAITGRLIAFGLIIVGAALIPAPLRVGRRPASRMTAIGMPRATRPIRAGIVRSVLGVKRTEARFG